MKLSAEVAEELEAIVTRNFRQLDEMSRESFDGPLTAARLERIARSLDLSIVVLFDDAPKDTHYRLRSMIPRVRAALETS
jgi:hypothetical protein